MRGVWYKLISNQKTNHFVEFRSLSASWLVRDSSRIDLAGKRALNGTDRGYWRRKDRHCAFPFYLLQIHFRPRKLGLCRILLFLFSVFFSIFCLWSKVLAPESILRLLLERISAQGGCACRTMSGIKSHFAVTLNRLIISNTCSWSLLLFWAVTRS